MGFLRPRVSYCVGLMNRGEHFREMAKSLQAMAQQDWELVVADFGSTDNPFQDWPKDMRLHVAETPLPFTRAKALNRAAAQAVGDIICFLDADIVVPPDFQDTILRFVKQGTAFWPICYRLHEQAPRQVLGDRAQYSVGQHNGWWERAGYGLCAFHATDWRRLHEAGGWDEGVVRWGGEDNHLFEHSGLLGIRSVRRCVPDLFHLHHPRTQEYLERYHDYPGRARS